MLDNLGNIGEFIGALAVVISLVYLAIQVRRNTQQMESNEKALLRAESSAQHIQWSDWRRMLATNAELVEIWDRGSGALGDLDRVEQIRFSVVPTDLLYVISNVWERYQAGISVGGTWESNLAGAARFLASPGGEEWWSKNKRDFPRPFADAIDAAPAGAKSETRIAHADDA